MEHIAIIGTGMIGRAWALVFAQAGLHVTLWDPDAVAAEQAVAFVRQQLDEIGQYDLLTESIDVILSRLRCVVTIDEALSDADYVQENGPENLETRKQVFSTLDQLSPDHAVLASSTSGMPASSFTSHLAGRHRCLVAHPGNPPYLLPLVELCPSEWTSPDALARARELMLRAKRQPAVVQREREGFVLNRLQGALLAEAFRLVDDGVITPTDLDVVVKHGLGLRWSFMGPFETIDLNAPGGIGDFCARYSPLYERLQQQMPPRAWSADLVERIEAARRAELPVSAIEQRQAWRDRRLMALAVHKAKQADT
jgi:L-gulonate 3-dehydrogenase